jgi:hypothetical protein
MSYDIYILISSIILIVVGTILVIWLGTRNGYLSFLGYAHWVSLVLLILAGIFTWISMVWMIHPSKFKVNNRQWVALGFSIFISILWWGRYAYTVAETAEEADTNLETDSD